jgi:hypothetical protein
MKTILSRLVLSALVLIALVPSRAQAADLQPQMSNRMDHRTGAYASLFGDPIGLVGASMAYNLSDFARVTGSIGYTPVTGPITQSALSLGTGVKLVVPGWNLTPVLGSNVSLLFIGGTNGFLSYENLGLEYTADNGFHIGAGVNGLFVVAGNTDAMDRLLPYVNVGLFF